MQKLLAVLISGSLLMVGCGKKQDNSSKKSKHKHVASLNQGDIPVLLTENKQLLNDEADEFAFVDIDDEFDDKAVVASMEVDGKKAKKNFTIDLEKEDQSDSTLVANLELDEDAFDRVQFEFNKSTIKNDQKEHVNKDVALAKKMVAAGKDIVVSGHTCQMGPAAYNIALSQKRAEAVKKEMMREGLPAEKVKTLGLGYESPLVMSDATERTEKIKDLAPNRRAEVNLV